MFRNVTKIVITKFYSPIFPVLRIGYDVMTMNELPKLKYLTTVLRYAYF